MPASGPVLTKLALRDRVQAVCAYEAGLVERRPGR